MIKSGVVTKDQTPCPVTGKPCTCSHPENECENFGRKVASIKELGDLVEKDDKQSHN